MKEPIVTEDDHVYDKQCIQEWFRRGNQTSPMTKGMLLLLLLLAGKPLDCDADHPLFHVLITATMKEPVRPTHGAKKTQETSKSLIRR